VKHIPVNRWTLGLTVLLAVVFGNDFIAPIMKAIAVLSSPYVPAI